MSSTPNGMASETVMQYILRRLRETGVSEVFGVPGDYSFTVQDAVVHSPDMEWIGCCNELNAAYAADGYARVHGIGAVNTTYGVGELSAINAIAGSYAEQLPVFHIVGMPAMPAQSSRALIHHTLGNGEFGLFHKMAEPVVCASTIISPQNAAHETERLISQALYHRKPVYMAIPADVSDQPLLGRADPIAQPTSDPKSLEAAVTAMTRALDNADQACILPGLLAHRAGLKEDVQALVNASGRPFATMFADKSALDEQQPAFIGMYNGKLMERHVGEYVESCDTVVMIGTMMSDFNSGAFTADLDTTQTIDVRHHDVSVYGTVYPNVEMKDVLNGVAGQVQKRTLETPFKPRRINDATGTADDPIDADTLYSRWSDFLRPNDIVMAETGTVSMGMAFALLPQGANFFNQTLWGAIGWATPAAFGAAVAAPDRRLVLMTGEGSHQMTAQEISQFARRGLKPIVFVLNNSGYLIERMLCREPEIEYNDIAQWHYADLPRALGCNDWFTARVTTCGELDAALKTAAKGAQAAYIEIVTDKYVASPLARKMSENL